MKTHVIALSLLFCMPAGDAPLESLSGGESIACVDALESLARQPDVLFDDHTAFSFETPAQVGDLLAANSTDAELLDAMTDLGFPPEKFGYIRLGTSPLVGDQEAALLFGQSPACLLQGLHGGLLQLANPGKGDLLGVELVLGCTTDTDSDDYSCVTLLVGVRLDGTKSLILGLLGKASGESYLEAPRLFLGEWMYEACAEVSRDPGSGGLAGPLEPVLVKKGKLKKFAKNYAKCFRSCFSGLNAALTPLQLFCLTAVALGCIPAGPGWGACFLSGAGACVGFFTALQILACGVFCL